MTDDVTLIHVLTSVKEFGTIFGNQGVIMIDVSDNLKMIDLIFFFININIMLNLIQAFKLILLNT